MVGKAHPYTYLLWKTREQAGNACSFTKLPWKPDKAVCILYFRSGARGWRGYANNVCVCMYVYMYVRTYVCTYVSMHVGMDLWIMYLCMYVCICIYLHIYIYIYIYTHTYVCVHTYIHTHTHTHTHTHIGRCVSVHKKSWRKESCAFCFILMKVKWGNVHFEKAASRILHKPGSRKKSKLFKASLDLGVEARL